MLLDTWFSGTNQARALPQLCLTPVARDAVEAILPSLEAFRRDDRSWPVLLPVVTNEAVTWYGCTYEASQARELQSLLTAWIGPSWSDFSGRYAELNVSEPGESLLQARFGSYVFRLNVLRAGDVGSVTQRLSALCGMLRRRPLHSGPDLRTAAQLRADLDRALLANDAVRAQEVAETLRRSGRLSAENVRFLDVRVLAGLGKWEELYELHDLLHLCELRLPPETFADIVEAVYRRHLAEFERAGDIDSAIEIARTGSFRRFASLFRTRRHGTRPAVLKAFLVWELAGDAPTAEATRELLGAIAVSDIEVRFRRAIESVLGRLESGRTLAAAERAFDEGRFDQAFLGYLGLSPSLQGIKGLLACVREIGTPQAGRQALDYVERAPPGLRREVEERWTFLLSRARKYAAQPEAAAPESWGGWLQWVSSGGDREAALAAAREGARSWSVRELTADRAEIQKFTTALTDWALTDPAFLEGVYPSLHEAFIVRGDTHGELRPLYSTMLSIIRIRPDVAASELGLAKDVIAMCLACNPPPSAYREILGEIKGLYDSVKSYQSLDWAIDVCDLLSAAACPDAESRRVLIAEVFATAEQYRLRLTPVQTRLLQSIGSELGLTLSDLPITYVPDDGGVAAVEQEVVAKVAIYSLDPHAPSRARTEIQAQFPAVTVELNDDAVCTERLQQLARTADVFAFAWKSSTHQAFYCVKDHQGPKMRLCLPSGAGSSSLVRVIYDALTALSN